MRDVTRVIAFLCREVIPGEEVSLIKAVQDVANRAMYAPPELQAPFWRLLAQTLRFHAGLPGDNQWKIRMDNICADREQIPKEWKE